MAIRPTKNIIRVPEQQCGPITDLLEIFIHEPCRDPHEDSRVLARPYMWDSNEPKLYAVTCPHCGQGIFFNTSDIQILSGRNFASCPTCKKGNLRILPLFEDPFVNPIRRDALLPPTSAPLLEILEQGSVLDRIGSDKEDSV